MLGGGTRLDGRHVHRTKRIHQPVDSQEEKILAVARGVVEILSLAIQQGATDIFLDRSARPLRNITSYLAKGLHLKGIPKMHSLSVGVPRGLNEHSQICLTQYQLSSARSKLSCCPSIQLFC